MAYLFALCDAGVFQEINVSFLPVGHTHTDVDQMFSRFSKHLQNANALTRQELLQECCKGFENIGILICFIHF